MTLAIVLAGAAGGYWWFNRPPGAYKVDNGGLFPLEVANKVGFVDAAGSIVIPAEFDATSGFSEGLAAVLIGSKYGYIDQKGKIVITPQFDAAQPFRFGRAGVKLCCGSDWMEQGTQHKFGFIETSGRYISAPEFGWVGSFSGDLAPVRSGDGTGTPQHLGNAFVNRDGQVALSGKFRAVRGFSEGLAAATVDGTWGYIDTTGAWSIPPQFQDAQEFADGRAPVRVGGKSGYIDRSGRFVVNPQYVTAQPYSEGRAVVETDAGGKAVIDPDGAVVVPAGKYQHIDAFSEGKAVVVDLQGLSGFIDRSGREVIPPRFDWAGPFHGDRAQIVAVEKRAYITPEGAFVTDPFPGSSIEKERARVLEETKKAGEQAVAEQANREAAVSRRLVGKWTGSMAGYGMAPFAMSVELLPFQLGGTCGRFDQPTLACGGVFTCSGSFETGYVVEQVIEYGQGQCLGGVNRIEAQPDGTLLRIWFDPRTGTEGARGTLTKVQDTDRVAAQPSAGNVTGRMSPPIPQRLASINGLLEQRQYERAKAQCDALLGDAPGSAEANALCDKVKKTMQILGIDK